MRLLSSFRFVRSRSLTLFIAAAALLLSNPAAHADGLYVTSNGNVGIGTSSPGNYKLNVAGGLFASGALLNNAASNASLTLQSTGSTQWDQSITFRDPGGDWVIGQRWQSSANDFGIGTSGNKDQLVIASNGDVGIGTAYPGGYKLNVAGALYASSEVINNTASNASLMLASTGSVSWDQSITFRDPGGDWVIGQRWQSTANNFGIGTNGNKDLLFMEPNGNTHIAGYLSANLPNIGVSTNDVCFDSATSTLIRCSSSKRYKEDIRSFKDGLSIVTHLRPVTFRWKKDKSADIGLVAEEVADISPELAARSADGTVEGVQYRQLAAVLVQAVQDQQKQIDGLRKAIEELRANK